MDKYRRAADKKLKGAHPDMIAREALVKAEFSSREWETFFDEAYGELMVEYFINWYKQIHMSIRHVSLFITPYYH